MPVASLELFPERPSGALRSLEAAEDFSPGRPSFVSVTCSHPNYAKTLALCSRLLYLGQIPAAHLLCAGLARKDVDGLIDAIIVAGIRHVVALRGDNKFGHDEQDSINDVCELVSMLNARGEFDEIIVAGYPDIHPEAESATADLQHLVRKILAGANRVITQFCFEVDTLCTFRDRLVAAGVRQPISAGLLPIRNFAKMIKFAEKCKTSVPASLRERFAIDPANHPALAQDLLNQMTKDLVAEGFDIHYYTLNSVSMINEAWRSALAGQRQIVG